MIRFIIFYILFTLFNNASAKEVFTKDHIDRYMNIENPYIYSVIGQKYIYKQKEKYQLGNFDTNILLKYDDKDYPATEGEFFSTAIEKPIENGMEFSLSYRRSEGTQEYNNIKTGDEGEVLAGVKIPVFSVASDMSKRKLDLYSARLDSSKVDFSAKDNIRLLYFDILVVYYKVLYYKAHSELVQELLTKTLRRNNIIKERVEAGSLADIVMLESKQQIINRKQQLISAKNDYQLALENFLKYLNIKKELFLQEYTLPSIIDVKKNHISVKPSLSEALQNRPDLKVYDYEKKKLNQQDKFTSLMKYPNINVGLYGVHDFKYDDGFKVTLDIGFPIERRKYIGKSLEIQKSIQYIDKQLDKKIIDIQTNLTTISNSIYALQDNIKNSKIEMDLVERLEDAENKKYNIGLSNLFMINQRELYTLQVKKKFLKYNYDYLILQEELNKVIGKKVIKEL